ncbi:hypothetical protein FQA39_LY19375 [Lamprigera yunnana]|nr:hypothetical protein FQA39_LY19375 [Lamprigera yunnana]
MFSVSYQKQTKNLERYKYFIKKDEEADNEKLEYESRKMRLTALTQTAIAEISANDADSKVYLLNLDIKLEQLFRSRSVAVGRRSERMVENTHPLRKGEGYELQYAELDETHLKQ